MKAVWLAVGLLVASAASAQDYAESDGAMLRFLDKLTSVTGDVTLSRGQAAQFGRLVVRLDSCPLSGGQSGLGRQCAFDHSG